MSLPQLLQQNIKLRVGGHDPATPIKPQTYKYGGVDGHHPTTPEPASVGSGGSRPWGDYHCNVIEFSGWLTWLRCCCFLLLLCRGMVDFKP